MIEAVCPLCKPKNEQLIFSNDIFRIIHVNDEFYPGYIRLILNHHVVEMTDVDRPTAHTIFATVLVIEQQIRDILKPDKVNLAILGNMAPHLHWHIIPRYKNDRHFPNPIWGEVTNLQYQAPSHLINLQSKLMTSIKINVSR